jgi:hypothetical protein
MPRRILVLNERDPSNPLGGGAEVHVFEIFGRLAARGHEVTLLAASFRGAPREERMQGVRVCRLANRYLYYGRSTCSTSSPSSARGSTPCPAS